MAALIEVAARADCPYEVVLVLSNRSEAEGLDAARLAGIETAVVPSKPFGGDREAHERAVDAVLRDHGVEVVALAGWMRILTAWFVDTWTGRLLNIHPSLLPKYPGLDTHARALEAGDSVAGCTIHLVSEGMDAGPILAQAQVAVLDGDTPQSLAQRVLAVEHRLYPQALEAYCARLRGS